MPDLLVIWSQGQESGPWGSKIAHLAKAAREAGFKADSLDYRGMTDPDQRVKKLVAHCRTLEGPIVLAGSSLGGYVAAAAAPEVKPLGLFLLAPAFYLPGRAKQDFGRIEAPIHIVHGWRDEVIPPVNSFEFAQKYRAALHLIDGSHRLKENLPEITCYYLDFLKTIRQGLP